MFSLRHQTDAKQQELTYILLSKTWPYVSDEQIRLVAENLNLRAEKAITGKKKPENVTESFLVSGKSVQQKIENNVSIKENFPVNGNLTDSQKAKLLRKQDSSVTSRSVENSRKRSYVRFCNMSNTPTSITTESITTGRILQARRKETVDQTIFQMDVNSGAPNVKRTRYSATNSDVNYSEKEINVFERVQITRKQPEVKPIFERRECWLTVSNSVNSETSYKRDRKDSIDVCIGSVQKALTKLSLVMK